MPKSNAFIEKLQREKETQFQAGLAGGRQEMGDVTAIVLHDEFGFGPDRLKRLNELVNAKFREIGVMTRGDTKDGEYSIAKFEQAIKAAYGPHYQEREVRYGTGDD